MTDVTITPLPAAPLHALELWGDIAAVSARIEAALGFAMPAIGRSDGTEALRLVRFEPNLWLIDGDPGALAALVGADGALTEMGDGAVRVSLSGPGWRSLLMEAGVFNAEASAFAPGCCAGTVIDHVAVRLIVLDDKNCLALVPASYAADLIHFWETAAQTLAD